MRTSTNDVNICTDVQPSDIIKPCDVVFVYGHSFTDDLIEYGTHGPSHVALALDGLMLAEANGGRTVGDRPLAYYGNSDISVWRDPTLTDAERADAVGYARSLYGAHYDWALIAVEAVHDITGADDSWYHEHNRYICSTFVDAVGRHIGRQWSRCANPAPVDLQTSGALIRIFGRGSVL